LNVLVSGLTEYHIKIPARKLPHPLNHLSRLHTSPPLIPLSPVKTSPPKSPSPVERGGLYIVNCTLAAFSSREKGVGG